MELSPHRKSVEKFAVLHDVFSKAQGDEDKIWLDEERDLSFRSRISYRSVRDLAADHAQEGWNFFRKFLK